MAKPVLPLIAMPSSSMLLLLQVLRGGGDVGPLLARGLAYAQIAELMNEARAAGLTQRVGRRTELSEAGERLLWDTRKRRRGDEHGGWIRPLEEFRIPKLHEDDPFLPREPPDGNI